MSKQNSESQPKTYKVSFKKGVEKSFAKFPEDIKEKLALLINRLEKDPRPSGVKKLKAEDNLYRIRSGNYRIIYEVYDSSLIIIIIEVAPRSSNSYKDKS